MLGSESIWAPLVYQYAVGGALFFGCLAMILRSRACDIRRPTDRFWLFVAVGGMVCYFAVHLAVYLLAIYAVPSIVPNRESHRERTEHVRVTTSSIREPGS